MPWPYNPFTKKLDKVRSNAEINALIAAATWLEPPIERWWDPTAGLPVGPAIGDRYGADGAGSGWTDGYIYEWDGASWVESIPEEGWMVWALLELIFCVFFSGGWMEVGEDTYLMLDTSNDPLTGELVITPASGTSALRANKDIILKSGQKLIFDGP